MSSASFAGLRTAGRRDDPEGRDDAGSRRGPRSRRRHRGDRGLHPPDLLRGRPRDHPPAQAGPHAGADDARRRLRPDGGRRCREEADLLVARQPRRRIAPRRTPQDRGSRSGAARDRGVFALRHGLPVRGGRIEPALLPDPQLLRVRHPGGEPEDHPDDLPLRGRLRGLRGPSSEAQRHDRARAAGRPRRERPDLGAPRLPEGGRVRGGSGDRSGGGARRRRRDPPRSQQDGHPGHRRGCRGGGAVRLPSLVRAGLLRPRQRVLPRVGRDRARPGHPRSLAPGVGPRVGDARGLRREVGRRALGVVEARPALSGEVDYGSYA